MFTDKEVQNLISEVQRISQVTQFNGTKLLDGQGAIFEFQVGTHNEPDNDRLIYDTSIANATAENLQLTGMNVLQKENAQTNLDLVDSAISSVSGSRSEFGALQNRLQSTINNLMIADENVSAANSRIRDVDVAVESSELTKKNILAQAGTAMLAQANQNNLLALKLLG